jgi:hypothetical protein
MCVVRTRAGNWEDIASFGQAKIAFSKSFLKLPKKYSFAELPNPLPTSKDPCSHKELNELVITI